MRAQEEQWYFENEEELKERYGSGYIVIRDQKVLGCYPSYAEAFYSVPDPDDCFIWTCVKENDNFCVIYTPFIIE